MISQAQIYLNDRLQESNYTPLQSVIESSSSSAHHDEETIIKILRSQSLTTAEIEALLPNTGLSVMESLSNMELADKVKFRPDGRWHLVGGL